MDFALSWVVQSLARGISANLSSNLYKTRIFPLLGNISIIGTYVNNEKKDKN